jgi:hypothetical protein
LLVHGRLHPKLGAGGLFTVVHATDSEIFVLLEARGKEAASARWQSAVTLMTGSEVRLRLRDKEVWAVEILPPGQASAPTRPYTTFYFNRAPVS